MDSYLRFTEHDENGKEVDCIDPVERIDQHEDHYMVDNGHHIYRVEITPGHTYQTRDLLS